MKRLSVLVMIFGLLFAFLFQANRVQLSQIPRESIKIDLGTKEAREYLLSGWSVDRTWGETTVLKATENESTLTISLPQKETYRLTIKAFSTTPGNVPNQAMEVHFNNVALRSFEFQKTTEWQKLRLTIPRYLVSEEQDTLKLIFTKDISLFPAVFDHVKFKNYFTRIHKGITLYLLYDPPTLRKPIPRKPILRQPQELSLFLRLFFEPPSRPPLKKVSLYSKFKAFGASLAFIILLWIIWLLSSRFLYLRTKLELSRLLRLDLLTYLPGLILLLLLALISFFSKYNIVYSLKTFFILSIIPTAMAKVWLTYSKSKFLPAVNRSVELFIKLIGLGGKKIFLDTGEKKILFLANFAYRLANFAYRKIKISRKLLIEYHKKNRSSAFVVDFMLLFLLCFLLLLILPLLRFAVGDRPATWLVEWVAVFAYILLVIGVGMKLIAFFRENDGRD